MDKDLGIPRYILGSFIISAITLTVVAKYQLYAYVDWTNGRVILFVCTILILFLIHSFKRKQEKRLKRRLNKQTRNFDAHPLTNWVEVMTRSMVQDRVTAVERYDMETPTVDEVLMAQKLEKQNAIPAIHASPKSQKKVEVAIVQGTKLPSIIEVLQAKKKGKPNLTLVHSGPIQTITNLNFESEEGSPDAMRRAENVRLTNVLKAIRTDLEDYFIDYKEVTFEDPEARAILTMYIIALSSRLNNLGIPLTYDESFKEADTLQTNGNTRELPFLNEDYLDPTYEKE